MQDLLLEMKPKNKYLVCVDSDGCVFDNMELKHKECFCPATINVWGLQGVSRYAREAAEFVNLYSKTRGTNRYPAVIRTLELLGNRKEAKERGYRCPDLEPLKKWVAEDRILSVNRLMKYNKEIGENEPVLATAIRWAKEVDKNIKHIVRNVSPFPGVVDALKRFGEFADIVIVSATPHEAIVREWGDNGLLEHVTVVAGQELGSKAECIKKAFSGRYAPENVLMIGEAPGDQRAAESNRVLFYPIIPGRENESWQGILDTAADRFRTGTFAGEYMDAQVRDFNSRLLDLPPWETEH